MLSTMSIWWTETLSSLLEQAPTHTQSSQCQAGQERASGMQKGHTSVFQERQAKRDRMILYIRKDMTLILWAEKGTTTS